MTGASQDLPISRCAHRYSGEGIFTVSVTGNQSDGQSATRKIILELKNESTPGSSPSDLPPYLIVIAMIITGAVIVAIVLIIQRKKEPVSSGKPRAFPGRAGPLREDRPSPEELKTICSGTV